MKENEIIEETNNDRRYTVYMHTSPSGKRYIGITKQKPEKRWLNGKGYNDNAYFSRAISKYGWENFLHEILFENLTKEEAEQKEIELIAFYKSNQPSFGYNIANGGNCVGTVSEETKKLLSTIKKEFFANPENNPMYGKFHTEETKEKMSILAKKRFESKENHPLYGKHHSEETKQKIGEGNKGKFVSEETRKKVSESNKGKHSREVLQFTMEMEFVARYSSLLEAHNMTGINYSNISSCCRKKLKHAGYYIWRYADDENSEFREAI